MRSAAAPAPDWPSELWPALRTHLSGSRALRVPPHGPLQRFWAPFDEACRRHTLRSSTALGHRAKLGAARRLCARLMLELDDPYWAFDWGRLLAWEAAERATHAREGRSAKWRNRWAVTWSHVTTTLFFLGALPYHDALYRGNHRFFTRRWLGEERAQQIAERFLATARAIGYRHERQVRKQGLNVLYSVLVFARTTDPATLTRADLEAWEAQATAAGSRSRRVARASVTCIERVLAAMGYLGGEAPRAAAARQGEPATWGRTAPAMAATFERFLADLRTVRRPGTVESYRVALRRFGDWLREHDPAVGSVAEVRRAHIEAFKLALERMRCGDYTNAAAPFHAAHLGEPLSAAHKVRAVSCLRAFFERIEVLEYAERPGRPLFVRGDVARLDQPAPRFIPDADWQRLVATIEGLTPERALQHRLPRPFERTAAILAILLECALRAGELCRLDTGCLVMARDAATHADTHWLRVPLGKLHTDRLVPVRPALVHAVDAWMRARGPQPLHRDERTGKPRDLLFTWQGRALRPPLLNACIGRLCALAGVPRYTSHQFRHTLAVQWRRNGMRLETISRLLGHSTLQMTLRYAAVMPATVRREFDAAFAAIDAEQRSAAAVRVVLSPEAHLEARRHWRESLWVDLGIGFCGLSAYLPCANRLACLPCPNWIPDRQDLPLLERQRSNLIELRTLVASDLPSERAEELAGAVEALDQHIAELGSGADAVPASLPSDDPPLTGGAHAPPGTHPRHRERRGAPGGP